MLKSINKKSGVEGNRTPVQTYSPKAFYMLILLLFVGSLAGNEQTNKPLSWIVLSNRHSLRLQHSVFFFESAAGLGNRINLPGGPNDYLITD